MDGLGSLAALEGEWRLDREIRHTDGSRQHVTGTARFHWQDLYLVQDEEGVLTGLPGGAEVKATRRYLWQAENGMANILFDDRRPFHAIPLGAEAPCATHLCAPDTYRVSYAFDLPAAWQALWSVDGPRKSYVMTSRYRRPMAGAA